MCQILRFVIYLSVIFFLTRFLNVQSVDGYWDKQYIGGPACAGNNYKLLSLLNLLCNSTQTTSIQTRDACYGCFFRAGSLLPGQTQLTSLSQCATLYLMNTTYATCATNLASVAIGLRPTISTNSICYSGYCEFVRCVRKINSNSLIDSCFQQNQLNRNLSIQNDRIFLYTNITACILARVRCNQYNPITGEQQQIQTPLGQLLGTPQQQQQKYGGKYYPIDNFNLYYNSMQISTTGDLRIITFPSTIGVADIFCSPRQYLDQAPYADSIC